MDTRDQIPPGYISVTEVLQPYSKLHMLDPNVVARAADRGSRAHKWCTMYALHLLFTDVDEDCKGYVEAFKPWCDNYLDKIILEPVRINSPEHRLSGEFDLFAKLKGSDSTVLIDIKTPASESPSWQLQTAGYKLLLEEEKGVMVDRRLILQLPKHGGKVKVIEHCEHEKDEALFLNALKLWRHFNG